MKRRQWAYVCHPANYDIECDKCHGTNITWSEWEQKIWRYDCEEDVSGTGGIFDGPIPLGGMECIGISLNRVYLNSPGKMFKPVVTNAGRIVYRQCSKAERARFIPRDVDSPGPV